MKTKLFILLLTAFCVVSCKNKAAEVEESAEEIIEQITEEVVESDIMKIDLNNATDDEILAIPGVGKKMLHEFKEYRPYTSMEQWRREIGKYVDDEELARLEQYVSMAE